MTSSTVNERLVAVRADQALNKLAGAINEFGARQVAREADREYSERPLRRRLLEVIGLVKTEDRVPRRVLSEQGAVFRGALLGFAGIELSGHTWLANEPTTISADFLDMQRHAKPAERIHTPAFRARALAGFELIKSNHSQLNQWNYDVTGSAFLSGQFSVGIALALQVAKEADLSRVNSKFEDMLQQGTLPEEEMVEVEERYKGFYD